MADASPENARAHWAKLCEGLQASPLEFYKQVEAAVGNRSIPDTVIERVEYREGGALSGVRQYLRGGEKCSMSAALLSRMGSFSPGGSRS
jgi:hypothetical protein